MSFKNAVLSAIAALSLTGSANAQILLSGGLTYSQDFDSLINTPDAGSGAWTDNLTLSGWYMSRAFITTATSASTGTAGTSAGVYGPYVYPTYRVGNGSANNGSVWSFGTIGAADRALGTIASGTIGSNVFGLRIKNDTGASLGNLLVSYTGEQWRNGGNTATQPLTFSYQISSTPFASPIATTNDGWTIFSALTFTSPTVGATAATLDGNLIANQVSFSSVLVSGVTLNPGEEIFLKWSDINDSGNDHGFGVDNFSFAFSTVPEPSMMALAGLGLLSLIHSRRRK